MMMSLSSPLQDLVVALLVVGSAGYAAWALMPSGWRRSLAAGLLARLPYLPRALADRLRTASRAASGCGCDGCDRAPAKKAAAAPVETAGRSAPAGTAAAARAAAATAQPITFHPRVRH